MIYTILIGALGFGLMAGAEWAGYKKIRFLKPVLWFAIVPVFCLALTMAWVQTERFSFPGIVSIIAWIPLILFFEFFLYSLYVEIPLRKTYVDSPQPTKVVTNGTYSLCRHPAFLWFIGWLVSAVFISKSMTMAIATPIWLLSYIGCIFLEEKLCCLEVFGDDYKQYQRTTPMFVPTRSSMKRFGEDILSYFHRTARH